MLSFTPQTELDAVNQMLQSIGQSPVNALPEDGVGEASIARTTLHHVSREIQSRGWWFNTDYEYTLAQTATGQVLLPSNALSVDPKDHSDDFVERLNGDGQRALWDRKEHTFTLDKDVDVNIIWFLSFEALPEQARAFIAARAGRVFQATQVGSQILFQFTKERETETWVELQRAHTRSRDRNIFNAANLAGVISNRHYSRRRYW